MEVSRNMKILAKLASMNKEAQGNPMLVSSLIGAGAGGLAGDLTSQLLWKKPTKTQRILSALVGAGLGAGTGAAVTGSFGHKAVQNLPARLQSMYQNAVGTLSGKLPSKEDFASMSPTAKAMYGSTNTGDKAADRLGAVVNTIKKSLANPTNPDDKWAWPINLGQLVAGGITGTAGYKTTMQAINRQGRRMQLINALKDKAATFHEGSRQRKVLDRMAGNMKFLSLRDNIFFNPYKDLWVRLIDVPRFKRQVKDIRDSLSRDRAHNARVKIDTDNAIKRVYTSVATINANRKAHGQPQLTKTEIKDMISQATAHIPPSVPKSTMDAKRRSSWTGNAQVQAKVRGAGWLSSLFGLSERRAGDIYDKANLGTGYATEHKVITRNQVIDRPVGKAKRGAAGLIALIAGLGGHAITGRLANDFLTDNNARYQQGLTNLQNAYK